MNGRKKPRPWKPKHSPEPWAIPGANVFRVVAPSATHQNKPKGMCPPYGWAIVCDTDPDSVSGEAAAENALRIVRCVNALEGVRSPRAFMIAVKALMAYCAVRQDVLTTAQREAFARLNKISGPMKGGWRKM